MPELVPMTKRLTAGTASTPTSAKEIKNIWTLSCIRLVVEGQPFDISKDELLKSPYFKIILSSKAGTMNTKSRCMCKNTVKPIVMEDVRAIEMDALCRVLYGKGKPLNGCDEWMRVLRLAHKWGFKDVRALAIGKLTNFVSSMSGTRKMELGKEFYVADWTLDGLVDIVQTQDLELDQLVKEPYSFDYKMAGKIVSIRSQAALKAAHVRNNRCNLCADESYVYPEWDALFLYHARALAHKEFYEEINWRYRNDVALRTKACEEVENTLFRVLKQGFTAPGTVFENKFLGTDQLEADAGSAPGQRLDNPIVLTDADEMSFRAFLRALYSFMWQGPVEAYDDWLGVLRLATLWKFEQIRKRAIEALEAHSTFTLPPDSQPKEIIKASLLKLQCGREYHVRKWVTDALCALLQLQGLSPQDFVKPPFNLGWELVARVFYARRLLSRQKENGTFVHNDLCPVGPWGEGTCTCALDSVVTVFEEE